MDRAFAGDVQDLGLDLLIQVALEGDAPGELVDLRVGSRGAPAAVQGMNLVVRDLHRERRQLPPLALSVHPDRHGRAGAESHREVIIGTGTAAEPAIPLGLVGEQPMPPGRDNVLEPPLAGGAHANSIRSRRVALAAGHGGIAASPRTHDLRDERGILVAGEKVVRAVE